MNLRQGTLLKHGEYRIERELGHGGFGVTYSAVQVGLNRRVAIKEFFMSEYCNRDAETSHVSVPSEGSRELVAKFRNKFIKEAQNIAGLKHPHIISIYDVFEDNGTAYYVMEYLDHGSLADVVKRQGRLSEADALSYTRQIADALRYIHARKMNHLDVKPGNILIDENNGAVLIDFGLSKRYDDEGNQTSTTPVGISHGYAPLEQYKKGGVGTFSPATDIYSLGATLYKLVTGATPPDVNDILTDGLPSHPGMMSASVYAAIEQAMQPNRNKRPQTIEEFLALLDIAYSDNPVIMGKEDDEATVLNVNEDNQCHVVEKDLAQEVTEAKKTGWTEEKKTSTESKKMPSAKKWLCILGGCIIVMLTLVFWPRNREIGEQSHSNVDLSGVSKVDSFSYAMGIAQAQGLKDYLVYRMDMDTTYMPQFLDGLLEVVNTPETQAVQQGVKAENDAKRHAYFTGISIGQQVKDQIIPGINSEVFEGNDGLNKKLFVAGFIAGVTENGQLMLPEEAQKVAIRLMEELKNIHMEQEFCRNKEAGEGFLKTIARTDGVVKTESGLCYKVITKGKGAIPTMTDKVKVHYRGTLIDGTEFDSSHNRNEPTTFRVNQVIAGWAEALTMMPVGSKWMLYIPQELAYGNRDLGTIKPFSTLVFEVELLDIVR